MYFERSWLVYELKLWLSVMQNSTPGGFLFLATPQDRPCSECNAGASISWVVI